MKGLVEDSRKPFSGRYPILTISAVTSVSSRSLERSYPLKASSRNRVSSAVALSSAPKKRNEPDKRDVLVDIADHEAQQFTDTSPSGNAEHENPAIARFIRAGETR